MVVTERISPQSIIDGLSNVVMFGERNFKRRAAAGEQDEDNGGGVDGPQGPPSAKPPAGACGDVLFSGGVGNSAAATGVEMWSQFLADTNANVGRITLASASRPSGTLCGLAQVSPVKGKEWKKVMALPTLADRVAALKDPATRALLEACLLYTSPSPRD